MEEDNAMAAVPSLPRPLEVKLKKLATNAQHTSSDHGKTPALPPLRIRPWNKVTIASVLTNGKCLTHVLDSSRDEIYHSWSKLESLQGNCDIEYRLVIAEDLPDTTQRILEPLLHDDLSILVDHSAGDANSAKYAELYTNVSRSPETISIALPCEPRRDSSADTPPSNREAVEPRPGRIPRRMIIYPQRLDTDWWTAPSTSDHHITLGENARSTYHRVSCRMLPKQGQSPPLCRPEPTRRRPKYFS